MAEAHTHHHTHGAAHHAHHPAKPKFAMDREFMVKLVLLAIVAYTFISSVALVGGPSFFGDDNTYVGLASQVVHGTYAENSYIFSIRPLQIFPIAFFYSFGINILASSMWDIISFTLTVLIAFLIGRELYSEYAGLMAAFLLAMFPLTAILGTTISDDIPMMFINALAMLCLVYAVKGKSKWWYAALGASLIAGPLTTPEGFILIPIVVLFFIVEIVRGKIKLERDLLYFPIGVAVALALLAVFNYAYSGNPLITFTLNSQYFSAVGQPNTTPSVNQDLNFYPQTMFTYNILGSLASGSISNLVAGINIFNYGKTGFYFYALVIAVAFLAIKWERRAYIAVFWFVFGLLYLEFGPMHVGLSPFNYILSHRLDRFLTLIAVPLALCLAMAMARAYESKLAAFKYSAIGISVFAIILLASTGLMITLFWHNILMHQIYTQVQIGNYLSQLPNTTKIYFTGTFSNVLMYIGFNNLSRVYAYDGIKNCSDIPAGSYIIIPKYFTVFNLNYTPDPSRYCPQWQLVLDPQYPGPVDPVAEGASQYMEGKLYYNPVT
ncbi:MAG: glycosyltransferase family 39 protein [Candidatus Micrarchaeota archaeon]|nr:glycosyltransferase family 39 protein [Candidatus Micrarchaeota archaeon]